MFLLRNHSTNMSVEEPVWESNFARIVSPLHIATRWPSTPTAKARGCSRPIVVASTFVGPRDIGLRLARREPGKGFLPLVWGELAGSAKFHAPGLGMGAAVAGARPDQLALISGGLRGQS